MIICPLLSNPDVAREFEELKNATSEKAAYRIWSLNNGNPIDKAPNGADSILFKDLLNKNSGDRVKTIREKARIYRKDFIEKFGNWINPENVSDEIPEQTYSGEKEMPAIFSDRQMMATRTDSNGEPTLLELHMFKFDLKRKVGDTVVDNYINSEAYDQDIKAIRELAEENYDISIENAIKIYDAVLKYISEHGHVPYIKLYNGMIIESNSSLGIGESAIDEIIEAAFGEKASYPVRFAVDNVQDIQFDLPEDGEDAWIEYQRLLKKYPELNLAYESFNMPNENAMDALKQFMILVNTTDHIQGVYDLISQIKSAELQIENESNFVFYNRESVSIDTADDVKSLIRSLLRKYYNFRQSPFGNTKVSKTQITTEQAKKQLTMVVTSLGLPENAAYIDEYDIVRFNKIILEGNLDKVSDIISHSSENSIYEKLALFYFMQSKFPQLKGIKFKKLKGENAHFENGYVVIDPNASVDIAAEECLHPFVAALYSENRELFDELLKEAKKDFKKLRGQIAESYPGTNEQSIIDRELELVTQALSRHFADLWDNKDVDESGEKTNSIWKKAWDFIVKLLGIGKIDVLDKDITLRQLAEVIYKANNISIDNRYFVKKMYNKISADTNLQLSIFNAYTKTESERTAYLKQVENNYKASNPNATSEHIARIVYSSRIQYNTERINSALRENLTVIAQRFGLTVTDGYYTAPNTMSDAEKQLYEWTVNSLNKDTFEAYKLSHNSVYNIVSPDQESSLNVIYQAITDGNLQTLDKELARNYIRIFWKSDLIQAGLKIFDDGHTTIQRQEQKLVDAITQIDPEQRIHNKTLLDYVKTFWSELLSIAKKIFANKRLSASEKLNFLNGITSAVANSQDLDIIEGIQPIYDRMDGNFDSSRLLSDKDKAILAQIKAGTHVRLKSQLSRNVKNSKLIADLKLRLEILDNVDDDNIDEVFDSLQQFLETADIELQKTLRYINEDLKQTDMSTWDALKINYIKLDLIGFYEGLLSNVNGIFNDPTSSIAKFNKARVAEGGLDLEAMSKQLSNDIRNLGDVYTRDVVLPYAEKILVDFVNDSNAVKDKPTFIKNMKHWLYQDCLYGDLQAGELIFGMASRSRSPIVRIIEKMMSDVEFEKGRIVLKRGRELMSLYNKIRPFGSQLSFANFQKLFIELDGEDGTSGLPTGYFARETNYGRFYADKDAYEAKLRDEFVNKGLKWKLNPYTDQIQLIFPDTDYTAENSVYNQYYDKLDEWLDEHCERRYTLEYYKAKRRFLSPAALQAQSFIQRQIDLLVEQAITERGNVDTNKLTPDQKQKLRSLRKQKHELASPYLFTTDSNGIVLIQEKQGEDLQIAKEISAWNKHISDKVKYKDNSAAFDADLKALEDEYGKDSRQVRQFIYDNKQQRINPMFWDYISSKIDKAKQSPEYEELKARYRDIINHVKDYNGFVVPDLSKFGIGLNQNQSVWAELKRLEQRMSEIRRKGTKKDGEDFNYLTTRMVPLLGGEDKTFYQYLYDKWASQFNEHPELRDTFANLFTYVDKKGVKRILEVFKYITPSSDTFDPGIPTIITTLSSQYSEIDENSEYVNKKFNKTKKESMQPKVRKAGTKRIAGKIDYTNDNFSKIMSNEGYKKFYDLLIQTMQEANSQIPTKAVERQYLLPQITGRGMSILGRSLIGHELLSSIGYGIQDFVGYKFAEQDKDVSTNWDLPRRPDGTIVNNVPIRFVKRLEKPWLVSTDIIGSVMMYYDMAMNYGLKAQNLPHLELLESAIDPINAKPFVSDGKTMVEPLDKQFEKVKNLMDFRYYGKEDRNIADQSHAENKLMQSTTTIGKRFRSFASLSMLALNFTTIEVGYIDAFLSSIADSIGGKYFGKEDLAVGYAETLKHLPKMLCNLGNPDVDDRMVCAMQYNQLSRSNSEIFDRTDQSRASKLLHMTLMGGYTMGDYLINTMILGATYNHYKLVDMPDGNGKAFMSKSDAIDLYTKYGYTEKEAIKKYNSSKTTLKQAYEVKDGHLTPKKEYTKYINKKLENQIAGRLRDRTHLYNGVIPMSEKAKILQNVWGSYVTLMRNFYVNTYWERAAVGFDYADQEDLPSGAFSRYVSEKAGMVNFETGETGNALGMSFLHGLAKYVVNARRLLTHKDVKKLSRDQQYAVKRISSEITIIGLSVFMALWSLAFARRHDLDDKASAWIIDLISTEEQKEYDINLGPLKINTDDAFSNMLNWVRWKIALLATRTMTERSTFYWPGTGLELIQSVSTAQSYTKDLGYMIDLFMDLLSINGHDSSASVKTGGYSDMSRGTRDLIKIAGPLGIDNLVRNWHTNGLKSTLNWYSGITPNNFILPNKSTWEEQEGISTTKSSRGSSKAGKK